MTADFYIKKLEQGYLVTRIPQYCNKDQQKKEWAFATLVDMLSFLSKELSK